jgi:hypothetical protein
MAKADQVQGGAYGNNIDAWQAEINDIKKKAGMDGGKINKTGAVIGGLFVGAMGLVCLAVDFAVIWGFWSTILSDQFGSLIVPIADSAGTTVSYDYTRLWTAAAYSSLAIPLTGLVHYALKGNGRGAKFMNSLRIPMAILTLLGGAYVLGNLNAGAHLAVPGGENAGDTLLKGLGIAPTAPSAPTTPTASADTSWVSWLAPLAQLAFHPEVLLPISLGILAVGVSYLGGQLFLSAHNSFKRANGNVFLTLEEEKRIESLTNKIRAEQKKGYRGTIFESEATRPAANGNNGAQPEVAKVA